MNTIEFEYCKKIAKIVANLNMVSKDIQYEAEYWNPAGGFYQAEYILLKRYSNKKLIQMAEAGIDEFCTKLENFYQTTLKEAEQKETNENI